LETSVEKLEGTNIRLTVIVPASEVDKAIDTVYARIAKKVKIPGFRAGKAPKPVIDSHVGRDYVLHEATEEVVNGTYSRAIDAEDVRPIDQPEITSPESDAEAPERGGLEPVTPHEDFTYVAEVATRPELALDTYEGLSVTLPPATASDREIDAQLEYMAERFATLEPVTDRGVEAGDFVLLSFVGKVDGEDYEGNTVDKYLYEMNRGLMPAEFDRGLIGVRAGAETHIEFPIPETSSEPDYVGKTASFDVTVHEIKAKVLPPMDDEFAGNVGGFDTMEELRSDLRRKMETQKSIAHMQMKERETRAALAKHAQGDIPPVMFESRTSAMLRDFQTGLEQRETTLEEYVQATGVSPDQIKADIEKQAEESVREELALEALFRELGMDVTEADIDEELAAISSQGEGENKSTAAELRQRWEDAGVMSAVREQITQKKAMLWLLDHVTVIEQTSSEEGEGTAEKATGGGKKATSPAKKPAKKRAPKKKTETPEEAAREAEPVASADAAKPTAEDAPVEEEAGE
jgi:trigger factor